MLYFPRNAAENAALCVWAESLLDCKFERYQTIGVMVDKKLAAVAVYHNYRSPDIQISFASLSPRWAMPGAVKWITHTYPFEQLGAKRLTAIVRKKNKRVRRFLEGVGFKLEGTHPKAFPDGDACTYGLLRENSRYERHS